MKNIFASFFAAMMFAGMAQAETQSKKIVPVTYLCSTVAVNTFQNDQGETTASGLSANKFYITVNEGDSSMTLISPNKQIKYRYTGMITLPTHHVLDGISGQIKLDHTLILFFDRRTGDFDSFSWSRVANQNQSTTRNSGVCQPVFDQKKQ